MTAPMAADKMSLVQIMSPFFSLGGIFYDSFGMVIVQAHFRRNLHTILFPDSHKFALPPYQFCLFTPRSTGYMIENIIIEIDTIPTAVNVVGIDLIHAIHPNVPLTQIHNLRKIDTIRR